MSIREIMVPKNYNIINNISSDVSKRENDCFSPSALLGLLDERLISLLSGDLGPSARPYLELAKKLNLTEGEVLKMVEDYQRRGLIRRLGAVVVHQRSGYRANAMVVWEVPEIEADKCGRALASLRYVSHCYLRSRAEGWPFNLYTMIHAKDNEELSWMIDEMTSLISIKNCKVLKSIKELKKISITFFGGST